MKAWICTQRKRYGCRIDYKKVVAKSLITARLEPILALYMDQGIYKIMQNNRTVKQLKSVTISPKPISSDNFVH
jgi:hypothetical protein